MVSFFIKMLVIFSRITPISLRWYDCHSPHFYCLINHIICVITLVRKHRLCFKSTKQINGLRVIRSMATRYNKANWIAVTVAGCMYFGG